MYKYLIQKKTIMEKPILIIFEGIDRIGKTTFIKSLIKNRYEDAIYVKDQIQLNSLGRFGKSILDQKHFGYTLGIATMIKSLKESNYNLMFICDRLHLTAAAYAKILRNNLVPEEQNTFFEIQLEDICTPILITFVVDKVVLKDEVVDVKNLEKLNEEFRYQHEHSKIPHKKMIELNVGPNGCSNIQSKIEEVINFISQIYFIQNNE